MSTLYKSILQAQPADGDVVFVRRFTRDPPVRATWSATLSQFTTPGGTQFTVTGSAHTGVYTATYSTNIAGTGLRGWFNLSGGIYTIMINDSGATWSLEVTDAATWAWLTSGLTWTGGTISTVPTTQVGSPPIAQPSLITLTNGQPSPIILPASIVQAWRPL